MDTNDHSPAAADGGGTERRRKSIDAVVTIASLVVGLGNLGFTLWEKLSGFFRA
ncbi:hypothetical protein ACFVZ3_30415 [Kitasatospora purpeofusca]|uniref:hypothetical protein n=1 Tax=Kitasatospora purpeofusca TaxID=67352 RepID=UPI00369AF929